MANVRIVPAARDTNGACLTQGTKVYVDDKELSGVYKIVLTAEVNSVWSAEIHCYPSVQELNTAGRVIYGGGTWLLRLLNKLFRIKRVDVTAISDSGRKYDL